MKTKDQAFEKFKEWKLVIEKQTDKEIKYLRTDNGLEFCGEVFNNFCRKSEINKTQNSGLHTSTKWSGRKTTQNYNGKGKVSIIRCHPRRKVLG